MNNSILINATIQFPLDQLVEAVGPEVSRALVHGFVKPVKNRPPDKALDVAVARVVDALDHWERTTHTVGEANAREQLIRAVRTLRATVIRNRRK
ncbi:hypothetical protein F4V91_13385 [Neorhizobium galegae]|uniref:Uncharacterized protein n=1 Tax=Neorhizobium galegae TaxID=399 RepID=A0A6A1TSV7_NEOGA|nr:hypothetical protein [Neorhizobium galegae]KAB1087326.1 hypothetical protein F4V91_13385 [Neorhizobium galegae]